MRPEARAALLASLWIWHGRVTCLPISWGALWSSAIADAFHIVSVPVNRARTACLTSDVIVNHLGSSARQLSQAAQPGRSAKQVSQAAQPSSSAMLRMVRMKIHVQSR